MDDDLLDDEMLEELLGGRVSGRAELEGLEQFVQHVRSWSEPSVPMPSPELDRFLQGGVQGAPVVSLDGERRRRRPRWRGPITVAAITAIAGGSFVTAAAAEVLPARLQRQVAELVDRYTPFTVPDGLGSGHPAATRIATRSGAAARTTVVAATSPASAPVQSTVSTIEPTTSTGAPNTTLAPTTVGSTTAAPASVPATGVTVPVSGPVTVPVTVPAAAPTTKVTRLALADSGHGRSAGRGRSAGLGRTTPTKPTDPTEPSGPSPAQEASPGSAHHSGPNDVPSTVADRPQDGPAAQLRPDDRKPRDATPQTTPSEPSDPGSSDQHDEHSDQGAHRDQPDSGQGAGHDPVNQQGSESAPKPNSGSNSGSNTEHGGKR